MSDEGQILLQYLKVRRVLNLISGGFFMIYIIVFPALYFSLPSDDDYSYILYAPLIVCLLVQIICGAMILHYRRKALNEIAASANNYTQVIAHAPPGTAIPYQHPSGQHQQNVFYLPPDAVQQLINSNRNVASFPSQHEVNPPPYSLVVSNGDQSTSPSPAGWVVQPPLSATSGSNSSIPHATSSHHSRNDSM
ncbi:Hypothetical predicted protein [Cloeon dipterum]|uniref:Uncharacterized protein n=1 Tax=Cloeon dipterum TaxID=197152 RepID=A0A8S1DEJ8_9INSE|nr:Hypothetical predicted protein [Cloeon dipterum]